MRYTKVVTTAWNMYLLGGLRLCCGKRVETRFRTQKTGALLAYLALFPARTHPREELALRFWEDDADDEGRASLRVALNSLRKQLETPDNAAGSLLVADRVTIGLRREAFVTDVARFEEALAQAARVYRTDPQNHAAHLAHLTDATTIYTAPLLPGFYDDWVSEVRERLHSRFLNALEESEKLHRRLGQTTQADAVALRREQSESSDRVAAGEGESTAAHAALPVAPAPKAVFTDPLPHFFTRFWGREREMAQVGEYLRDAGVSVLTLLGPGGIGKTRLSVEAARAWGGVCVWVPVASVVRGEELADALRESLNLPQGSGDGDDFGTVTAHLRELAASETLPLLVWDNFEQVEETSGARFVARLLRAVPQARMLVSSRRRLGVPGECFVAVETLPLPDESQTDPAALLRNPAAALFADRARSVTPDFAVTARNAEAVATLTRLLDGLPLAIELAAAWVSVLTPGQMVQKLSAQGERFALLASRKTSDRVERHRSLWNTIGWSYDLLSPDLRTLWRRLSVFHGGFTATMAETVAGESFTFDGLARLRERSLIRLMAESDGDDPDEPRYELLESLREFASERIAEEESAEEGDALRLRHIASLQTITDLDAAHGHGPLTSRFRLRYKRELLNVRRALAHVEDGRVPVDLGLDFALRLSRLWRAGYVREGCGYLQSFLRQADAAKKSINTKLRAKVLMEIGVLHRISGDMAMAEPALLAALEAFGECGDANGVFSCRQSLGTLALLSGRYTESEALLRQALSEGRALNNRHGIATCLNSLGYVADARDDFAAMRAAHEEELAVRHDIGEEAGIALAVCGLAVANRGCGDFVCAEQHFAEAFRLFHQIGDDVGLNPTFFLYGELMIDKSEWERAAVIYGIAEAGRIRLGITMSPETRQHVETYHARCRHSLGTTAFDALLNRGATLSQPEAVAVARRET
ncbi:MAG: tetratricopeptide repeat protein [Armatimonadetes bacterium]|nr:tetratricopeptide repeat protein [Armatimonadota bacterium]